MRFVPRRFGFSLVILSLIAAASTAADAARAQEATPSRAEQPADERRIGYSGQPVPRFVALKKDKAFGRAGPDLDDPVLVIYRRRGLPLKVIGETQDNVWRRVEDVDGRRVWIHRSMLAENQHAVIQASTVIFSQPTVDALPRARLEPGVIARLETCDGAWCRVRTEDFRGWTDRGALWGSPL
ncbi:MAG: SH3 domain-containing protein [Pseudomonadota bacterium]